MILMRRKVYSVEKELSFQQMALEQLDVCMQKKMNMNPYHSSYAKNQLKMDHRFTCKT